MTSQHVGAIGQRIEIKGVMRKIVGSRPSLNIIEGRDGNVFTIRSAKPLGSERALMYLEGTVDAHEEYQGVKRTVLRGISLYKWED